LPLASQIQMLTAHAPAALLQPDAPCRACRGGQRRVRRGPATVSSATAFAPLPSTAAAEDLRIATAFERQFKPYGSQLERAFESWARTVRGNSEVLEVRHPTGVQQAVGYVQGLTAQAWHEVEAFSWASVLEEHAGEIQAELQAALTPGGNARVSKTGTNVWSPAARADAMAYGPQWRTLALQDRGKWDAANSPLFPRTVQLVRDISGVPSLECFFARQAPGSGIKPHSDYNNFIMTAHLGLVVPEGKCWMKVGDSTRQWRNGKLLIFDTSFVHETYNEADTDRHVLLIRFWHPEVTPLERTAIQFLTDCVDDSSDKGLLAASKAADKRLEKLMKPQSKGFGKR